MIMNIIFTLCMYPVLPIIYFVSKTACKPKKNIVLGVTLPTEYLKDPEVIEICSQYKKTLRNLSLLIAAIPIPFYFVKYISVTTIMWMLWLICMISLSSYPYIKFNKKLSSLKAVKQWNVINSNKVIVDLKTISEKSRTINKLLFVPPIIISFIPPMIELVNFKSTNYDIVKLIILLSISLISLLCFLIGLLIDRKKSEVINLNSTVNLNYNRAKKHIWENYFLQLAWINSVFTYAIWGMLEDIIKSFIVIWLITILYSILVIYLCFHAWFKIMNIQQKFMAEAGSNLDDVITDDDKYWIWGMIYYNPNEGSTMVDKRFGEGMTINMASKAGKIISGVIILALLSIPAICTWLLFEEFTPINLEVSNHQLVAEQIKSEYRIDINHIDDATLITKLPKASRRMGTGLDNLLKGSFSVEGYGDCELCLNPKNDAFIVVKTDQKTYIFSDDDNNGTEKVYQEISR